jgi:cell wall-associated NlpC family hydrolase
MTTVRTMPTRRTTRTLQRAAIAIVMAFGVTLTALPAQQAQAESLSFIIGGRTVTAPSLAAKTAVFTAIAQRGDPYVWGGAGPHSFDCSGLTQYAMRAAGKVLPHSSRMQSTMGRYIRKEHLRPGDLVFFYNPVSHVGIYIGSGRMIHASTYGQPVKVTELRYMPGYNTARRMV